MYLPLPGVGSEVLGLSSAGWGSAASQHKDSPTCEAHSQEAIEEPGDKPSSRQIWGSERHPRPQYLPQSLPRDSLPWNQPDKAERSKTWCL